MTELQIGDVIHGFCNGKFGRDDYSCKRVEFIAADWVVLRYMGFGEHGVALWSGSPAELTQYRETFDYCGHGEDVEEGDRS